MYQTEFQSLKIRISTPKGERVIYVKDIVYIAANKPYCNLFLKDNSSFLTTGPLYFWEKNLPLAFFQCNKSTIVNLNFILDYKEISKYTTHLRLSTGQTFSISNRRQKLLATYIDHLVKKTLPCHRCLARKQWESGIDPETLGIQK